MWFVWLSVGVVLGLVLAAVLTGAREARSSTEFSGEPRAGSAR